MKGILIDIDNTLYEYRPTHQKALNVLVNHVSQKFAIKKSLVLDEYDKGRSRIHQTLHNTAASHNRLLYIQKMLESLGINTLKYSLETYNVYWDTFLENISLFEGVRDFFENIKVPICLVTDLTAHIQYRKIIKMGLENHIDYVVTSEEAGIEKPDAKVFNLALRKLDMSPKDVVMVGDNYDKDIVGATKLGIKSYWLNLSKTIKKPEAHPLVTEIHSFSELLAIV